MPTTEDFIYRRALIPLLIFMCSFMLYLVTVTPAVYVGDAGELAVAPQVLTVAHPTGYPLFNILGKLFLTIVPFGNTAYKMGLFDSLASAIAIMFFYLTLRLTLGNRILATTGALVLACSRYFWSQAVITEVYALNSVFLTGVMLLVVMWMQRPSTRLLFFISFIYGLSLSHHLSMILVAPALLIAIGFGGMPSFGRAWEVISCKKLREELSLEGITTPMLVIPMIALSQLFVVAYSKYMVPRVGFYALSNILLYLLVGLLFVILLRIMVFSFSVVKRFLKWVFITSLWISFFEIALNYIAINYMFFYPVFIATYILIYFTSDEKRGNESFWLKFGRFLGRKGPIISTVAILIILGVSIDLYIPIRSLGLNQFNAICALYWGDTATFTEFLEHISGYKFRPLMFSRNAQGMWDQFGNFLHFVITQFTPLGALLIILGGFVFYRRNRAIFWFFSFIAMFNIWFCTNYDIMDIEVFYIPTYIIAAVYLVYSIELVTSLLMTQIRKFLHKLGIRGFPEYNSRWCMPVLVCLTLLCLLTNFYENDRSQYFIAHDYGMHVLHTIKGKATLLTQGWVTPYVLGYLEIANKARTMDSDKVRLIIEGRFGVLAKIISGRFVLPEGTKIYTTVPIEILGLDKVYSKIRGLIYEIGFAKGDMVKPEETCWRLYEGRDIPVDSHEVFKSYQCRSLVAKYYYLRGDYLFQQGEDEKAIELCEMAQKISPGNKQIHNNLGCIFFKQELFDRAEEQFKTALRIAPDFQQARHNLGNVFFKQGRFDEALAMFGINQRAHWSVSFFRPLVAQIFLKQGRFEDAIREFENAIQLDPENEEIHNSMGVAYSNAGKYREAIESFETALKLAPKHAQSHNNLGAVYETLGQYEKAEEHYLKAIECNSELADALNNLGILYGKQGRIEDSIKEFKKALKIRSDYTTAMNNLGIALTKQDRMAEAVSWWKKSLSIDPGQSKIVQYLQHQKEMMSENTDVTPAKSEN